MLHVKHFLVQGRSKLIFGAEPKNRKKKIFRIYLPARSLIFLIFGGEITIYLFLLYRPNLLQKKITAKNGRNDWAHDSIGWFTGKKKIFFFNDCTVELHIVK